MENSNEIIVFAETDYRNQKRRFGIKANDRRRHVYIVGKTGTGKTTLLENMAIQDIQGGRGIGIVDPHGEFAEKMLDFVPSSRINDVIYFNPADLDHPIAFNVLEKVDAEYRHLVASGLMGVFKKIWPDVWSARMEYILHNSVLALLEYPGSTLLGINKILSDKEYRQKVVEKLTDPSVKSFWINEFAKYPDRFREEAVAPIQNKVGQFISSPLIRNIIGQTKSSMDFREIMDNKKIMIMNLSKGKIGEDASRLLGALCITKLQLAAMSRVNIPEEERQDFYLYVDEFQNFATESFANILSEARKYRLDLILAHQYIDQLVQGENTTVKEAIFGNVGTMITFRVGAADAEFLEKEFEPEFMMNDLVNLGFAQIYLKLMIDGFSSRPFSALTLPPLPHVEESQKEKIIRISRERYAGSSRQEIEEKISRWSGMIKEEIKGERQEARVEAKATKVKPRDPSVELFVDKCWQCGVKVEVPFKPDGKRPVYCKDCLIKVRTQSPPVPSNEQVIKSEPIIKNTNQFGSLNDLAKKAPSEFKPVKKKRQEVDLSGLRNILEDTVGPLNKEEKNQTVPKNNVSTQATKKELKPGEEVEL
jgi:CxxC-x17-CxxC domain-containing protein